jgi:hypothetical protein
VAERGLREAVGASKGLGHGLAHFASALQGFSQALHVAADGESCIVALNETRAGVPDGEGAGAASSSVVSGPSVPELVTKTAALYSGGFLPVNVLQHQPVDPIITTHHAPPHPPTHLHTTTHRIKAISPGYAAARDQLGHLFAEILEHELGAVQALKALLQGREELAAALLKLQRKARSLEAQQPQAPQRAAELRLLQAEVGREEVRCYKYTKAVLCVSVPEAARARARTHLRAFSHLAAITTAAGAVAFNASLSYLGQLGLDPEQAVEEANDAAAALVLPPVPPIVIPQRPRLPAAPNGGKHEQPQQQQQQQQPLTTAQMALAAAKPSRPGSFLAEPAPIPSASETDRANGVGAAAAVAVAASVVLTMPSAPVPKSGSVGKGKGKARAKAKAPWESDDEMDDPFTPEGGEG